MVMSIEERENYIKDTVVYFRNQIEERGFIKYAELKERCTFNGETDFRMIRSIQWSLGQRLDITKYIKAEEEL